MSELARIGIAINEDLLKEFDKLIEKRGYSNRSEAFRDLIRHELVGEISGSPDAEVYGTVTLVYDHHARLLMDKLTAAELQPRVVITPEDVAAYYDAHYRGKAAGPDSGDRLQRLQEAIVADLGRRKIEEAFGGWIETLKQTYPVEVNRALWARMTEPAAVPTPAGK